MHRHMIHTDHTLCIRHTQHMLYTVHLERSCRTLEWVMGTLDKNTSDYLQDMRDRLEQFWEGGKHAGHVTHVAHVAQVAHVAHVAHVGNFAHGCGH